MSLKRKINYQLNHLRNSLYSWALPSWMTGSSAKLLVSLVFIACTTGYVFQISSTSTSGYKIHELEGQVTELQREIQKLELEKADFGTMSSIQERIDKTEMVAVGKIQYHTAVNIAVAKK